MAKKVSKKLSKGTPRASSKTKICPICNLVFPARGLFTHMGMAHNTKSITNKVEVPVLVNGGLVMSSNSKFCERCGTARNKLERIINTRCCFDCFGIDEDTMHSIKNGDYDEYMDDYIRADFMAKFGHHFESD